MESTNIIPLLQYGHTTVPKLLLDHYAKIGLKDSEMMLLLHIHRFIEDNHPFPTPAELADRMSISESKCSEVLMSLIKRNFLKMDENQDDDAVMFETYSLSPLYERVLQLYIGSEQEEAAVRRDGELYEIFEQEFSRPLSPMECETIKVWLDQDKYDPDIIQAALRETVLSGKLNLRYMDRILHEWHKNGVRTTHDAREYSEKFRRHQQASRREKKEAIPKYPNINWLDET
ncbi:DnaD domain-containing protein [Alteribacillus iranensis]|uniref:DNA replication protein DnaD n=1 Tax=Alteribacillus iranensis TaxID=930128 RepID=A0A1I1ZSJ0_9BACI|nr:DnaD domain-containing protein [Alteribacillus iranensis]SFE34605.1 DNA replication protein DnaD [Alteribacillus iranensis]